MPDDVSVADWNPPRNAYVPYQPLPAQAAATFYTPNATWGQFDNQMAQGGGGLPDVGNRLGAMQGGALIMPPLPPMPSGGSNADLEALLVALTQMPSGATGGSGSGNTTNVQAISNSQGGQGGQGGSVYFSPNISVSQSQPTYQTPSVVPQGGGYLSGGYNGGPVNSPYTNGAYGDVIGQLARNIQAQPKQPTTVGEFDKYTAAPYYDNLANWDLAQGMFNAALANQQTAANLRNQGSAHPNNGGYGYNSATPLFNPPNMYANNGVRPLFGTGVEVFPVNEYGPDFTPGLSGAVNGLSNNTGYMGGLPTEVQTQGGTTYAADHMLEPVKWQQFPPNPNFQQEYNASSGGIPASLFQPVNGNIYGITYEDLMRDPSGYTVTGKLIDQMNKKLEQERIK